MNWYRLSNDVSQQDFFGDLEKEEFDEEPRDEISMVAYLGMIDDYDVMFRAGNRFYVYRLRFKDWVDTVRLIASKSPAKALNWAKNPEKAMLGAEVNSNYPMPGSIIRILDGYVIKP